MPISSGGGSVDPGYGNANCIEAALDMGPLLAKRLPGPLLRITDERAVNQIKTRDASREKARPGSGSGFPLSW
jgi:hypothetical protein